MKRKSIQFRRSILAAACVVAAGAASANDTFGPTGSYDVSFGQGAEATLSLRDYILAITAPQQNPESVSALIQAASAGMTLQGWGGDHPVTVGGNKIAAAATGNSNVSSADLALLRSGGEGQDGIALATSQLRGGNYYGAQTQARVEESRIAVESHGMTPAAVAIEGNAITASAALNQSSSTASGAVSAGHASMQSGASGVSQGVEGMHASTAGSINVATYQVAQQAGMDAGSGASVLGGGVGLSLQGGGSAQQGLSLKGNTLAADYLANSATGVIEATGGNAFQGSAIVTNAQLNADGRYYLPPVIVPVDTDLPTFSAFQSDVPRATATVEGSRISADLGGSYDEAGPTRLAAALAVTGNTIAATSAGNSAGARLADGTVQAGNAVIVNASTVRGGYNYAGAHVGANGSYSDAELYADLGVLNTQANRSTTLASRVLDSGVSVRVDRLDPQAAIAVSGNRMQSAATGNLAGNLIDVRATDFGATAAAANVQSNDDASISATQEWARVSVEGGGSGRNVYAYGSTQLADNAITATAGGNVAATNVSVQADRLQAVDPQTGSVQAMAQAWEGTYAAARGGVTATNVQSNTGFERSIEAGVYGGIVGADLSGGGKYATFDASGNGRPRLSGALVALTGNTVAAQATGNSAATGATLAGTDGLAHAAVTNAQSNDVRISASTMEAGVIAQTGPAEGSTITVQGNAIAAAATANQANNTLSSKFTSLDVSSSPYYYYDGDYAGPGYYYGSGASTMAVQGVASAQRNGADVSAINASEYGFATATVSGRRGAADTSIAVQGNQATAAAAGNQVRNAIAVDAGSMAREYSMGAPIAEIGSLQENDGGTHAMVSGYGHELSIGAHVQGALAGANVTVSGNTAAATATANDASNSIAVTGGSLAQSSRYDIGYGLTSLSPVPSYGGTDFNLASTQIAYGNEVTAQASDVRIAVERGGERNDYIGGSTVAVSGNTIAAEARANNAANALGLTGFNSLASSAAVSNEQHGETRVASIVDGAQLRVRSVDSSIGGSQLAMKDNTVQSLAVGASATNGLDVQATTLQGATTVYGPAMTLSSMDYAPSGYAVGNSQSQWGTVSAQTEASVRMNLSGSGLEGGSATVSGNAISAVAQSTSASNTLNLAGTTIGQTAGMVTSSQSTSADVSAMQTAQRNVGATFVVEAGGAYGTPVTVSNNSVLASAGQNEAFNSASVRGASVAGQYGVLNAQQGSGLVTATAQPGLVGVSAAAVYGGSLSVSGNTVAAKAAYNTAANTLAIEASAASAAAGMVRNEQTTSWGNAVANVGGYEGDGAMVGVAQGPYGYGQGTALNGSTVTVNGNSVSADASGNTAANTLGVAAPAAAGYGYVYGPAYQVLNSQTNQAALSANVIGSGLLVNSYGAPLQGSAVAVTGNTLAASATGNSASNVLSLGAAQSGLGQGAAISNVQYNNASINAAVRGAMIGSGAGMVGGGSTMVTGNAISAQAVGNTAVNKLLAK